MGMLLQYILQLRCRAAVALLTISAVSAAPPSNQKQQFGRDLSELSLEELLSVEVTSVSRKEQKLAKTAAAVFVITQDDIRRSGFTSVPEALRMAPGLQVARIDANKWAISSRGFNGLFSNKLLVLFDGRSVYSPLFSGVYWDLQDTLMEDIDRIEVIRGPGAAMWGANAVNGVINVITKKAKDTQGGLLTSGAGGDDEGFGAFRYGTSLGSRAFIRGYGKYRGRNSLLDSTGRAAPDSWNTRQSGFRMDWNVSERDSVTITGDTYNEHLGQQVLSPSFVAPYFDVESDRAKVTGGNIVTSLTRRHSDRSETRFQFYLDRFRRDEYIVGYARNTYDFDLQHRFQPAARHDLMLGLGYRLTDDTAAAGHVALQPASRATQLFSFFAHDEIELVEDRLTATAGVKLERNDFTGLEVQPSGALWWNPTGSHTLWASVGRAVRLPNRVDHDVRLNYSVVPSPDRLPFLVTLEGNPAFRSEVLMAYEAGYRTQPYRWLSLDITGFYNSYQNLSSSESGPYRVELLATPPRVVAPFFFGNFNGATSQGIEFAANWTLRDRWKLTSAYSSLRIRTSRDPRSTDPLTNTLSTENPAHQVSLRSQLDLTKQIQFDVSGYYVGPLRANSVPGYVRLDTRVGWRPNRRLELSAGLQNLLDKRRIEFVPEALIRGSEVGRRNAFGQIIWRF
jgi:iron complex outermembrane receptor protein